MRHIKLFFAHDNLQFVLFLIKHFSDFKIRYLLKQRHYFVHLNIAILINSFFLTFGNKFSVQTFNYEVFDKCLNSVFSISVLVAINSPKKNLIR